MNTPIKHLPEPTPAETIAAFTYSLSRQEALYGVEPLNVERVINRMAQAIQKAIDAEVARICEANGIDKLLAKIARLQGSNCALADKLAEATYESNKWHREFQKCREADNRARNRGERTDLVEKELARAKDTAEKLNSKLNDARHIADSLREENRRMAVELEGLRRFRRLKADEMPVRVEHPAILAPTAKAE